MLNPVPGTGIDAHASSFASSVMFALSRREMGQPALAPFAMAVNFAGSMPGIFAVRSRCDSVTVNPASVFSKVMVAVAWMDCGGEAGLAQFGGKRHGKTAGVGRAR